MKSRKKLRRLHLWLMAGWVLGAPHLSAQEISSAEIAAREQEASQRLSDLNRLSQFSGRFKHVRDTFYEGEYGIVKLNEKLQEDINVWIRGWDDILGLLKQENGAIQESLLAGRMNQLIQSQAAALPELKRRADAVSDLANQGLILLANAEPLREGMLPEHENLLATLQDRNQKLQQALLELKPVGQKRIETISPDVRTIQLGVMNLLRNRVVAGTNAPLARAVTQVQETMATIQTLDPVVQRINQLELQMTEHFTNYRYFQAEEVQTQASQACPAALSEIDEASGFVTQAAMNSAKARVQRLCSNISRYWTTMGQLRLDKPGFVDALAKRVQTKVKTSCSQANTAGQECYKASILKTQDLESLKKANDGHLKFIEKGWTEVQTSLKNKGVQ